MIYYSVTKERTEVVIEGSDYSDMENPKWLEYEFKCKPGNVSRAPCLISPYHYRLVSGLSVHQALTYLANMTNENLLTGLADVVHCIPKLPVKSLAASSYGKNA